MTKRTVQKTAGKTGKAEAKKDKGVGRGKGRSRRRPCVPPPESEL